VVLWELVVGLVALWLVNVGAGTVAGRYDRTHHDTVQADNGVFELRPSPLCAIAHTLLGVEFAIGLFIFGLAISNTAARIGCIAFGIIVMASLVGQIRVAHVVADDRNVVSRNWLGVTETVQRSDLEAIAVAGWRNPVLAFVKRNGQPAFAIPQRWWRPDNVGALADFLRIPLRGAKLRVKPDQA
jgi:hypothetical protein